MKLTVLPLGIGQLSWLTSLDLCNNQLTTLPPELGQLTKLTWLNLSKSQLKKLPPEIGHLTELTVLDLRDTQLTTLPPELGRLTKLKVLYLSNNQLTTLPPELGQLTKLKVLYLSNNQLTTLPPELGQLTKLKVLYLYNNRLATLPPELGNLAALTELSLHDNPALDIPLSILGPTSEEIRHSKYDHIEKVPARPQDILQYYLAQREAAASGTQRKLNEIKVMLVGRGGAGKTSLRRFFTKQPHDTEEKETPGIALDTFPLLCAQETVTVRLWDFAGQEITHALHHFFLTEGCVYILVLDPRSNTEMRDAEYWLALLQRYAIGAPVLVALNHQDERQGGYDVDRRPLQERFPAIQSFIPTNCATRTGCESLLQALRQAVEALPKSEPPHLLVPESWMAVMAECATQARGTEHEAKGRPHLKLEEFRQICVNCEETEPTKQEFLARLLHRLGAVLHFVDEPRLKDTAVLDPHWVTDGVYRLLRFKDRPGSDGTLTLSEALEALPGEGEAEARFLLRLMERFEMCFPLDEDENGKLATKWLIPGALEPFQPDGVSQELAKPDGVRLRYIYDPLPEGVLPRFIVMTSALSEGNLRWRNGVVLDDGAASAVVRRGARADHVEITGFGPEKERLRLLEIVQGTLERIHAGLPAPKPLAELELAGLPGAFRSVADLEAAELSGQKVAVFMDTPQVSATVEPTPQLNRASDLAVRRETKQPLQCFLSYSHEDKKAKAVFQLNLTVMTKKKLITPWHDGLIEPGTLWREEIERQLGQMDVFVGLLTNAFIASDFIENVELRASRAKAKALGRDFLFVLILVDDISLEGLDLSEYQILRPGGKAVCQHANRKAGFNQAQKELEELVRKRQRKKPRDHAEEREFDRPRRPAALPGGAEGVTILVHGNYYQGDHRQHRDQSIRIAGDAVGSQVGQVLQHATNRVENSGTIGDGNTQTTGVSGTDLTQLLDNLKAAVDPVKDEMKVKDWRVLEDELQILEEEAQKEAPDQKRLASTGTKVIELANTVTEYAGPVVTAVGEIMKACGVNQEHGYLEREQASHLAPTIPGKIQRPCPHAPSIDFSPEQPTLPFACQSLQSSSDCSERTK